MRYQSGTATLASGTATVSTVIYLEADSEVIVYPVGAITGTTNLACFHEVVASRTVGAPGTAAMVLQAKGNDGAIDADAAGVVRFVILTP